MNKVVIIGRNVKDIEQKITISGTPVIEFSVAVKRTFKNASGEYESDFFNCIAFSKLAERISLYVKKGDLVGIEGRLQTRNYINKEGKKVYVTEIIVENVEFLQTKKQDEQPAEPSFMESDPFSGAKYELANDDDLPF